MPIVINDFEIVVEPPESKESRAQEKGPPKEEAQVLRPDEIVRVMQVHEERMKRVRAD